MAKWSVYDAWEQFAWINRLHSPIKNAMLE